MAPTISNCVNVLGMVDELTFVTLKGYLRLTITSQNGKCVI